MGSTTVVADQASSEVFVIVEAVPGFGYRRGDRYAEDRWVARARRHHDPPVIQVRAWLRFLRFLPLGGRVLRRIMRHELEHLLAPDFAGNQAHHDDPSRGAGRHFCGRSYSWRGFLSEKHLRTPKADAEQAVALFLHGVHEGESFAHPFRRLN